PLAAERVDEVVDEFDRVPPVLVRREGLTLHRGLVGPCLCLCLAGLRWEHQGRDGGQRHEAAAGEASVGYAHAEIFRIGPVWAPLACSTRGVPTRKSGKTARSDDPDSRTKD